MPHPRAVRTTAPDARPAGLRTIRLALAAAALAVAAGTASAQSSAPAGPAARGEPWPARTVRIVVPSPGGTGIDAVARALAQRLAQRWANPVIVDNRPGANSLVGTEIVARAAPDGYTLLFASDSTFTVNPHLYAQLPYDPLADFAPVAQIVTFHQLLVAHPSLGAATVRQFVARARAQPGQVTYASFGVGSAPHLLSELLQRETRTDLLHVPYKGLGPAVAAVLSGEATLTWAGVHSTQAHVEAGRLTALAIAAPARSPLLPDVPTFAELGHPTITYTLWFGLFAPAATPRPLVAQIARDVGDLLADAGFVERELRARGYEPSALATDRFAAHLRREHAARATLVKQSGARAE